MLTTSAAFTTKMMGNDRKLDSYVIINGTTYDSTKIIDWEFHDSISFSDVFEIGTTIANTFTVSLQNVNGSFDNLSVEPFIGIDIGGSIEYVTLGKFTVDNPEVKNISTTQKNIKLTCFDRMLKLDIPYSWIASDTDTIQNIANRISSLSGVPITGTFPTTLVKKITGFTCREVLGFIASLMGGVGIIDRSGNIAVKKFTSPSTTVLTITGDHYFESGLNKGTDTYTIGKVTGKTLDGASFSNGSVTSTTMELRFENPWVTQALVDALGTSLIGLSYVPFTMEWQGNPALESGDNIKIDEYGVSIVNTVLMDSVITYPHFGMNSETRTEGKSTNSQIFSDDFELIREDIEEINVVLSGKEDVINKQPTPPPNPVMNAIWIDTSTSPNQMKRWDGTQWVKLTPVVPSDIGAVTQAYVDDQIAQIETGSVPVGSTSPSNPITDMLWVDTSTTPNQLKRYNGTTWVAVDKSSFASLTGTIAAAQISAATITGGMIAGTTITAANIAVGTITGDRLVANTITGSKIAAGTIEALNIKAGTITANEIAANTITSSLITTAGLDASVIKTGTLSGDRILGGTVTGVLITGSEYRTTSIGNEYLKMWGDNISFINASDGFTTKVYQSGKVFKIDPGSGGSMTFSAPLTMNSSINISGIGNTLNILGLPVATQNWVSSQGYVSSTYVSDNYVQKNSSASLSSLSVSNTTTTSGLNVYGSGTASFGGGGSFGGSITFGYQLAGSSSRLQFNSSTLSARNSGDTGYISVTASSFPTGSRREWKKDITDYPNDALQDIINTPIKHYRLLEDMEFEPFRTGIIMDEAPLDVVDPNGQGVELYAMTSMSWKAIQQLNEIIVQLQNEINELKGVS